MIVLFLNIYFELWSLWSRKFFSCIRCKNY